jgi:hypothetical protein
MQELQEQGELYAGRELPPTFEIFWKQSCAPMAKLANILFYSGTALLLVSVAIFEFAQYVHVYMVPSGAYIFVAFIGVALLSGLAAAFLLPDNPTYSTTRGDQSS